MSAGDSRPPSDDSTSSSAVDRSSSNSNPGSTAGGRSREDESIVSRFLNAESGPLLFVRETLTSVAAVAAIGLLLFTISGVWPPMVAVESGSMQPHMHRGDLVFITEPGRLAPDAAHAETGVVTYTDGEDAEYRSFGDYGSVIIYDDPNGFGPPIIHRARFWVDDGENWYDEANRSYLRAGSCEELANCPAPHAGFITKGDNNARYDQANGIAPPVRPDWIDGVARVRIPWLGCIRLGLGENSCLRPGSDSYDLADVSIADADGFDRSVGSVGSDGSDGPVESIGSVGSARSVGGSPSPTDPGSTDDARPAVDDRSAIGSESGADTRRVRPSAATGAASIGAA
jgi:signal peptidase